MLMSKAVDELAAATPGKKALAIEAFARALRQVLPMTIFVSLIQCSPFSCLPSLPTMPVTIALNLCRNFALPTTKESRPTVLVRDGAV